jgi:hypothetical protein
VLRLDGSTRGPKLLLRNDAGDVFGLFAHNAQPTRLYAAPLVAASSPAHPLARLHLNGGKLSPGRALGGGIKDS